MVDFIFSTINNKKYLGTGSGNANGIPSGTKLKGALRIPIIEGLYGIAERAFIYQENITELIIDATITVIGNSAFFGCGRIKRIFLPSSVTNIGDDTFNLYLPSTYSKGPGIAEVYISSALSLALDRAAFCWKEYFHFYYCGKNTVSYGNQLFAYTIKAVLKVSKYINTFASLTAEKVDSSLRCDYNYIEAKKNKTRSNVQAIKMWLLLEIFLLLPMC